VRRDRGEVGHDVGESNQEPPVSENIKPDREQRMSEQNRVHQRQPTPVIHKRWHGPYVTAKGMDPAPAALLIGIDQFNRGEFFEQHETLEELWRGEADDVRYLYHGILLVGVGIYHLSRRNYRGAVSKLEGGLDKLRWFEPVCQGVDVSSLVADASRFLEQLRDLGPERVAELDPGAIPKVRFAVDGRQKG
jgi:uncharacterized protein